MSFTNNALLRRYSEVFETDETPRVHSQVEARRAREVVVAESDPTELEHIASILRSLNFRVLEAHDGHTALNLARRHVPVMVLSSLKLAGLDGYKLSQRLREAKETEGIPFMFIVEPGQLPDRIVGHQTYAHDYIQKPISIPDFKSRVNLLVNLSRAPSTEARGGTAGPGKLSSNPPPSPSQEVRGRVREGVEQEGLRGLIDDNPASIGELVEELRSLIREFDHCLGTLERNLSSGSNGVPAEGVRPGQGPPRDKPQVGARGLHAEAGGKESAVEGIGQREQKRGELGNRRSLELVSDASSEARAEASRLSGDTAAGSDGFLEQYRAEFQSRHRVEDMPMVDPQAGSDEVDSLFELFLGPKSASGGGSQPASQTERPLSGEMRQQGVDRFVPGAARDRHPDTLNTATEWPQEVGARPDHPGVPSEEGAPEAFQHLYTRAVETVRDWIRKAGSRTLQDLDSGWALAADIVSALEGGSSLLLAATDRFQEFSVSAHSVNVAVLCVRFAETMERTRPFREGVCLAALLHEMGVVRLPHGLMFKKDPLSPESLQLLRIRPLLSAQVLPSFVPPSEDLADIVGQVFERPNGSGSPLGRKGKEIREEARIIGIVDAFETCIHRRPYRRAFTGYHTLQEFSTDPSAPFTDDEVKTLIRSVSLFPYNELLRLSNGEVARVVSIHPENLSRPVVEIISGKPGPVPNRDRLLDLAESPSLQISEVISLERLAQP